MKIKRIEIDPYDYGPSWEEKINEKLSGAVHVHTVQAPYNNKIPFIIFAFYPDEKRLNSE